MSGARGGHGGGHVRSRGRRPGLRGGRTLNACRTGHAGFVGSRDRAFASPRRNRVADRPTRLEATPMGDAGEVVASRAVSGGGRSPRRTCWPDRPAESTSKDAESTSITGRFGIGQWSIPAAIVAVHGPYLTVRPRARTRARARACAVRALGTDQREKSTRSFGCRSDVAGEPDATCHSQRGTCCYQTG